MQDRPWRTAASGLAAVAMLALPGCIIIAKPKPFTVNVAAREMDKVGSPPTALATVSAQVASPEPRSAANPPPAPAPEPARTDVKGKDDGSMKLDRVFISG
ncbi:MAG TPA: hypothetical protein VG942_03100, partial [Hyphomonadaceae bacterium]|nr:hypothetical protein [Hyphomonadaceae bacterium]